MKLPISFSKYCFLLLFMSNLSWGQMSYDDLIKNSLFDNEIVTRTKDVHNAFINLYQQANAKYKDPKGNTCNAFPFIKEVKKDKLIPAPTDLFTKVLGIVVSRRLDSISFKDNEKNQFLKNQQDRMFLAWSKSKDFSSFVTVFAGTDVSNIEKKEKSELKKLYDRLNLLFDTKNEILINEDFKQYSRNFKKENCMITTKSTLRSLSYKFPNRIWELKTYITVDCNCQESKNSNTLQKASYEYKATLNSIYTYDDIKFDSSSIKNAQLVIKGVSCCPEEEEENSSARNDANDDIVAFVFDYDWVGDGFSITVGGGPVIGDEADFFGGYYGAEVNYARRVSNRLRLLGGVGYTRYTGKETDFGFETDGESFIPVTAKASYRLSDVLGIEAGLGYAISASDGGEGGLTYSAGPFWQPSKILLIAINYINIAFGEGSLGAVMLSGRLSLSKK